MQENYLQEEKNNTSFESFEALLKDINKSWGKIKKNLNTWELNNFNSILNNSDVEIRDLNNLWDETNIFAKKELENRVKYINSEEYKFELENSFREMKMPFLGEFPEYDIIPLKLIINIELLEAKLFYGRKNDRTSMLNPKILSQWIFNKYKALTGKKFDAVGFMKELVDAYSMINKINYREKNVIWGKAVPLNDIYSCLTLRRISKKDYPKQLYMYELGQLKENSDMSFGDYKFELGFAKNPTNALIIIDSKGVESRLSSLTIYKDI
ncbi:MAG: hypothetical protein ACYDIA_14135 [Candidatus Humimicrobiaceae bacterium]